jgi:hypothetical protein
VASESTRRVTLPWLRRSVPGLSPRRPGFDPRSVCVRFVVHGVAVGQGYLQVPRSASSSFHQCSVFIRQSLTAYNRAPFCHRRLYDRACHGMSRRMQVCCVMKLLRSVRRQKVQLCKQLTASLNNTLASKLVFCDICCVKQQKVAKVSLSSRPLSVCPRVNNTGTAGRIFMSGASLDT